MYAAEYQTDWVIFQTVNVFCVGYRSGTHFFWSPIYNRRQGQEVTPPEAVSGVSRIPHYSDTVTDRYPPPPARSFTWGVGPWLRPAGTHAYAGFFLLALHADVYVYVLAYITPVTVWIVSPLTQVFRKSGSRV
jgi:hypothetical protein